MTSSPDLTPPDLAPTRPMPAVPGPRARPRPPAAVPAAGPVPGRGAGWGRLAARHLPLPAILGLATFLRLWQLAAVGFNSDEAVYTGSAASLAGNSTLGAMFPVFRAHPLLFQTLLSLVLRVRDTDWAARAFAAAVGVATVALTFALGRRLYGQAAGLLAALLLAVMPYHVIISRQVLLDGLMTLCATAALYCVARYADSGRAAWLLAAGSMMGAAVLSKETSIVLAGGLYVFFALTPAARLRVRHLLLALLVMAAEIAVWPVMLRLAGHSRTGQSYLLWQLFRRPNHGTWFYLTTLPAWLGPALLVAAAAGLAWLRGEATWRERLLLAWLAVPFLFFTIWPVKGFQYLLPISPPLAVLAGRALARPLPGGRWLGWLPGGRWLGWLPGGRWLGWLPGGRWLGWLPGGRWLGWLPQRLRRAGSGQERQPGGLAPVAGMAILAAVTVISLLIPSWSRIEPAPTATFLAGSGGLDGGRQAGDWIARHLPGGARLLAIGPSVANVLEFYGHRPVAALSVSTDPRDRNPSYTPVPNPDLALRNGGFQYLVWDAYTAARTPYFAHRVLTLVSRYHGLAVYTSAVAVLPASGPAVTEPAIVIYEVHP